MNCCGIYCSDSDDEINQINLESLERPEGVRIGVFCGREARCIASAREIACVTAH